MREDKVGIYISHCKEGSKDRLEEAKKLAKNFSDEDLVILLHRLVDTRNATLVSTAIAGLDKRPLDKLLAKKNKEREGMDGLPYGEDASVLMHYCSLLYDQELTSDDVAIIKCLIDNGAKVGDKFGERELSPLMVMLMKPSFETDEHYYEILDEMLKKAVDEGVLEAEDSKGNRCFDFVEGVRGDSAVKKRKLIEFLQQHSNETDESFELVNYGSNAEFSVLSSQGLEKVKVAFGDLNGRLATTDDYGRTPLMYAAEYCDTDVYRYILEKSKEDDSINYKDKKDYSINGKDKEGNCVLSCVLKGGYGRTDLSERVKALLSSEFEIDSESPALYYAVKTGNSDIVKMVIEAAAEHLKDENYKKFLYGGGNKDKNPLIYALKSKNLKVLDILLSSGIMVDNYTIFSLASSKEELSFAFRQGGVSLKKITGSDSPLMLALKNKDVIAFENLLSLGIPYTEEEKKLAESDLGTSAKYIEVLERFTLKDQELQLFEAIKKGEIEKVQQLLNTGSVNANVVGVCGRTPLMYAAYYGETEIVKLLIQKGADINAKDQALRTPLMCATLADSREITQLLLSKGANVDDKDKDGKTAKDFVKSSSDKQFEPVFAAFLTQPSENIDANTIFKVVQEGDIQMLCSILQKGVDLNVQDKDGKTPLMYACERMDYDVLRLLLSQQGINPLIRDKNDKTAFDYIENDPSNYGRRMRETLKKSEQSYVIAKAHVSPVLQAIQKGDFVAVKKYIINNGDSFLFDQDEEGKTLLMHAIENRQKEISRFLIDSGADVFQKDIYGRSAYDYAEKYKLQEIKPVLNSKKEEFEKEEENFDKLIKMLSSGESDISAIRNVLNKIDHLVDKKDENGLTPLMYAVKSNRLKNVQLLLEYEPNLGIRDSQGKTVMDYLAKPESAIGKYLLSYQAENNSRIAQDSSNNPYHKNKNGWTSLMGVIQQGCFDNVESEMYHHKVQSLIDACADINAETIAKYHISPSKKDFNYSKDSKARTLTPLIVAVRLGNIRAVEMLLQARVDLSKTDSGGWTALDWVKERLRVEKDEADKQKFLKIQNMLMAYQEGRPIHDLDEDGIDILIDAIKKKDLNLFERILSENKGINVKKADSNGKSLLMYAVEAGDAGIVKSLLEKGVSPFLTDNMGAVALDYVKKFPNAEIETLIKNKIAELNNLFCEGIRSGKSVALIAELIQRGYDVNCRDKNGKTPLMYAVESNNSECVDLLLKNGADVYALHEGKTVFDMKPGKKVAEILNEDQNHENVPAFFRDIREGNVEGVASGLKNNKIDVNYFDLYTYQRTPLMYAVQFNQPEIVELLLNNGADPSIKDGDGKTALEIAKSLNRGDEIISLLEGSEDRALIDMLYKAIENGQLGAVNDILSDKAKAQKFLNIKNPQKNGDTPLIYAARHDQVAIIRSLLEQGADRLLENDDGEVALSIASGYASGMAVDVLMTDEAISSGKKDLESLIQAIEDGNIRDFKNISGKMSAKQINSLDVNGNSPLQMVCQRVFSIIVTSKDIKDFPNEATNVITMLNGLIQKGAKVNESHIKILTALEEQVTDDKSKALLESAISILNDAKASAENQSLIDDANRTPGINKQALSLAIKEENVENVLRIILSGNELPEQDMCSSNGDTVFHLLARRNLLTDLKKVVEKFEQAGLVGKLSGFLNCSNKVGETPLSIAYKEAVHEEGSSASLDVVKFMLEKGANPYFSLMTCMEDCHSKSFQLVYNQCCSKSGMFDTKDNKSDKTYLMMVCQQPAENVDILLKRKYEDVSLFDMIDKDSLMEKDKEGKTALMYALEGGNFDLFKELIGKLKDPNGKIPDINQLLSVQDNNGKNLLMYAVESGNLEIVKLLIGNNPIPEVLRMQDNEGKTALMYSIEFAGRNENAEIALALLEANAGALYECDKNGQTSLMYAIELGQTELVKKILEKTSPDKIDIQDNDGKTAFMHACNAFNTEIMRILAKKTNHALADKKGDTALHYAVCYWNSNTRDRETIEILLNRNADFDRPNKAGKSVDDYTDEYDDDIEKLIDDKDWEWLSRKFSPSDGYISHPNPSVIKNMGVTLRKSGVDITDESQQEGDDQRDFGYLISQNKKGMV